jgi:hypothetical protein
MTIVITREDKYKGVTSQVILSYTINYEDL